MASYKCRHEIQEFCIERQGQPLKAVKDLSVFIQERVSGKHDFQYDIDRQPLARGLALLPVGDDSDLEDKLLGNLENTMDKVKKVISTQSATDSESADGTPSSKSSRDSLYARFIGLLLESPNTSTPQPKPKFKQVFSGILGAPRRFQNLWRGRTSRDATTVDTGRVVASPLPALPTEISAFSHAEQLPDYRLDEYVSIVSTLDAALLPLDNNAHVQSRLRSHSLPSIHTPMTAFLDTDNASQTATVDASDADGES